MNRTAWLIFLAAATLASGLVMLGGWAVWSELTAEERALVQGLWSGHAGIPILVGLMLVGLLGLGIHLLFRRYVQPLRTLAEQTQVIAMSNPRHRLALEGQPAELRALAASLNGLAERYQALQEDVRERIREANAALEEEKNTLAALMSKLTQGVLVCNREGRILLYNQRAQTLLEGPARRSGGADWIGLGRSIYGLLDEALLEHALAYIDHRLRQGDTGLMAPFVASRPGGQLLSVHLVPVLDKERALTGYILTLEDITRRTATESRRGLLLQSLTEGQRSSIAGIRAAIETILDYPQMDEERRQQFQTIIRDEALKLSRNLDELEAKYAQDLKFHWPLEEMLASDLLAALERRWQQDYPALALKVSAPLEPIWLKVDSYAIVQALVFVVSELIRGYRAEQLELKLGSQGAFASLYIVWQGAAVDMETLRAWGKQTVLADKQGSALTLHDVIERHGGAVWSHADPQSGRCYIRLLLSISEGERADLAEVGTDELGQDYDFRLFQGTGARADLEELPLTGLSYTVIDTETTGLNPSEGDEIIAIGAVRIVNGRILKREIFDCLINPHRPISEASVAVHGITPEMLRGMPDPASVLPQFHRFVEDTVIVGHNVAFDMRFLNLKEARLGIQFTNHVLDTLLLTYVVHPNQEEQSLEAIAARLGIAVTGRHTALGDALTTAEIFLALIPLLAEQGIRTLCQAKAACANSAYARIRY